MTMRFSAASHLGNKRKNNEDRYFARQQDDGSLLLAVADGMGGAPGGELAASLAIAAFNEISREALLSPSQLARIAMSGHKAIVDHASSHAPMKGMGTTLTAALVQEEQVSWVHIGDSRLYRLHKKDLRQLTSDHRFLRRILIDREPTREELRRHPLGNMLDQCLGGPDIELELGTESFFSGDCLLLCTDGLHDELSPEIVTRLLAKDATPTEKVGTLVEAALVAGGRDNITVIVAE